MNEVRFLTRSCLSCLNKALIRTLEPLKKRTEAPFTLALVLFSPKCSISDDDHESGHGRERAHGHARAHAPLTPYKLNHRRA